MTTTQNISRVLQFGWYSCLVLSVLVLSVGSASNGAQDSPTVARGGRQPVVYKVDPFWPKPLPSPTDAEGLRHPWVTGAPGGTCVDSHDHIFTFNRGFVKGGLTIWEGVKAGAIPAPPVVVFDAEGNLVKSWGDPTLTPEGRAAVMPASAHGCFADYENNIWLGSSSDGVVQKWSHDGKMLMQIGTKGVCDGSPDAVRMAAAAAWCSSWLSPPAVAPDLCEAAKLTRPYPTLYPTCGEPGANSSRTLLNQPADIAVDPDPDPVTKERGSVYIADGYGNHRVVVFDAKGKYLRQWGSSGRGPGQFVEMGGGHPHCVVLSNDGLVYTCDRGPGDGIHQTRIQVFDKLGTLKQIIPLDPPGLKKKTSMIDDLAFSHDPGQTLMFVSDLGIGYVWILERASGKVVGSLGGGPGHMAGQLVGAHTMAIDSKDSLYISETVEGRRTQKFLRVSQ
jgi:hypothetical protein